MGLNPTRPTHTLTEKLSRPVEPAEKPAAAAPAKPGASTAPARAEDKPGFA